MGRIIVRVKSKSREERVEKIDNSHYIIHVKEIPEKGKANEGVIRSLSKYFSISKSKIVIISGHQSHTKAIFVEV